MNGRVKQCIVGSQEINYNKNVIALSFMYTQRKMISKT